MRLSEPRPMRWELHWHLFGADFRVRPLFWVSCALLGVIYYQYPEIREQIGSVTAFGLWMAAVVVSMLAHEMGHAFAARWLGVPLRIVVSGFGGQLFGLEEVRWGRSVLIYLAGPLVNVLILAILWGITALPLPMDWRLFLAPGIWLLGWINAFWCLLNLLPLWPLDGSRIAIELGTALLGRRGQTLALLLSLVVSLVLAIFVILWMRVVLTNPFDVHYSVYFIYFCILALYCYAFWLSTFRALWGDPQPPTSPQRQQG
ncbi:MAG TPA: site-2 protease family protein [Gemmataceae bacterium]|nr:site-2 protease family protein [Gemmataceae bacterium]